MKIIRYKHQRYGIIVEFRQRFWFINWHWHLNYKGQKHFYFKELQQGTVC